MGPQTITAAILVICLVLVVSVYFLGYSMGRTLCAVNPGLRGRAGLPS